MAIQDLTTTLKGAKGDTGIRGSTWSSTAGVPTVTTNRLDGDQNLDTTNGDIYELQTSSWVKTLDLDAKGIKSTTYASGTGKVTFTFNDDTTFDTGDIRGADGVNPAFDSTVSVTTLDAGVDATASITGSAAVPILNLGIPKGIKGDAGGTELTALTETSVEDTPAVDSVLDIVLSGTWAATANHGILIQGLPSTLTDDTDRTELDLRYDATQVGTFRGDGAVANQTRLFTTPARGTDASTFIDDMVEIMNAPRTGANIIFPGTEGDRPADDYFNFTASKVGSDTLRLTSDVAAAWVGVTITIDGSGDSMTLQSGYVSNTLTDGAEVRLDETPFTADIARGSMIQWTDKDSTTGVYMYTGTETLTTAASPIVDFDTNANFTKLSA